MTSSPRAQDGHSHRPAADSHLPASSIEHSRVTPRPPHSWARKFKDPHDVTWWVHLVHPAAESDIGWREHPPAVMLRFQNGTHTRYLQPIPGDWRGCDEQTLWRYCEQAVLQRH